MTKFWGVLIDFWMLNLSSLLLSSKDLMLGNQACSPFICPMIHPALYSTKTLQLLPPLQNNSLYARGHNAGTQFAGSPVETTRPRTVRAVECPSRHFVQ
jgi:hypothetical protein